MVPHIFIHYEGKLRIKQFLELCLHLVDDIDEAPVLRAIAKYEEIVSMCEKSMHFLLPQTPESAGGSCWCTPGIYWHPAKGQGAGNEGVG